ncbi:[Fe-Fe] hydrogenase large subunit C-terminal domain-containing protein [Haloplasma contractile]|uniref:Ferredoxin hydrogenase large subunit protein n=1 Tax=Haloplasma contractile SSD-17B TaxID=1033810 RepID=F7Q0G8_9MOLU|nr:[Fe-Fe] hydrogenase large subunit C-terminal domain-containing protein [Haloplasma contractile]ERJ12686.1 ferredoxin hydrogenase large subunit protein [Haloplasma contractile SSD-17B]
MKETIMISDARCKDCYRCVRYCPVKAIGIRDGQARVVDDKCILCGNCVKTCPQNAKSAHSQFDQFLNFLKEGKRVVVSIAPSYLAATPYSSPWKLVAGLKYLGVFRIEETAVGAELISDYYKDIYKENEQKHVPVISSCCPTIVDGIKKYYPTLTRYLAKVISPMIAHGKMIKNRYDDEHTRVVFLGPCYSKMDELEETKDSVDAVINFKEVTNYFKHIGLDIEGLKPAYPDITSKRGRVYPLEGGVMHVSGINQTIKHGVVSLSGLDECMDLFKDLQNGLLTPHFIESLACKGGCVGGPEMANDLGVSVRRERLCRFMDEYHSSEQVSKEEKQGIDLSREHQPIDLKMNMPSHEKLKEILALTGKHQELDETNCGGCGYSSCREKAIAVYQGLAEVDMCIPYMREKAESLSNAVVECTDNIIIIVDEQLRIQEFNPAANQLFNQNKLNPKGEHLSRFIESSDFRKVWESGKTLKQYKEYPHYDLITKQRIYPLKDYGVIIGIFINVTKEERKKHEINEMKHEALNRASSVIREQMRVAQEIAGLLGESTAETKATLLELIEIMRKKESTTYDD